MVNELQECNYFLGIGKVPLNLLTDVTQNQIPSVRKQEREGEGTKGCVRKSNVILQLNCESTIQYSNTPLTPLAIAAVQRYRGEL